MFGYLCECDDDIKIVVGFLSGIVIVNKMGVIFNV